MHWRHPRDEKRWAPITSNAWLLCIVNTFAWNNTATCALWSYIYSVDTPTPSITTTNTFHRPLPFLRGTNFSIRSQLLSIFFLSNLRALCFRISNRIPEKRNTGFRIFVSVDFLRFDLEIIMKNIIHLRKVKKHPFAEK